MTQGLIVAISDDRRRRLAAFRRPDGLYVLHDQRLIDPGAAPDTEHDLVEMPFPPEGEAVPAHCHLLDMPLGDALYGCEEDARREARWLIRTG